MRRGLIALCLLLSACGTIDVATDCRTTGCPAGKMCAQFATTNPGAPPSTYYACTAGLPGHP